MRSQEIYLDCLAFQLSLVRKQVFAWYQNQLKSVGLSPTYVYVLGLLIEKNEVSPTDIAAALELKKPTVTGLVDRMIRDGFIQRTIHPESRRSLLVSLTPKGKKVGLKAYSILREADHLLNEMLDGKLETIKNQINFINKRLA